MLPLHLVDKVKDLLSTVQQGVRGIFKKQPPVSSAAQPIPSEAKPIPPLGQASPSEPKPLSPETKPTAPVIQPSSPGGQQPSSGTQQLPPAASQSIYPTPASMATPAAPKMPPPSPQPALKNTQPQPKLNAHHNEIVKNSVAVIIFVVIGFGCSAFLFKILNKTPFALQAARTAAVKPDAKPSEIPVPAQLADVLNQKPSTASTAAATSSTSVKPALTGSSTLAAPHAKKLSVRKIMPPPLLLNGISASRTGNFALINNRLMREGDTIDGARIVSIDSNKVELEFDNQTIVLRVR